MAKSIAIQFAKGNDSHRTWICCEDLSRVLTDTGLGSLPMSEADAVVDRIIIKQIPTRKLKRCRAVVMDILDKHHFHDVEVTTN
jgi:hypothetical protein